MHGFPRRFANGHLKEEGELLMGEWGVEAQRDKVLTWMETREVN